MILNQLKILFILWIHNMAFLVGIFLMLMMSNSHLWSSYGEA
jgi:hypothetical protein